LEHEEHLTLRGLVKWLKTIQTIVFHSWNESQD